MKNSTLEMVGGEKHINPIYDIKAESTSCYLFSKGLPKMDINEMLCYINKQGEQLIKAKDIIKNLLQCLPKENIEGIYEATESAEQFLREVETKENNN